MAKTYEQACREKVVDLISRKERMAQLQRDTPVSGYPAVLGWRLVAKQALIALGLTLGAGMIWTLGVSHLIAAHDSASRLRERFIDSGLWAPATISCFVLSYLAYESLFAAWGYVKRAWNLARYLRAVRKDWK